MFSPIRIAIVDPYRIVRDSLKLIFEDCPEFLFVGEASSARQMLSLCGLVKPNVVLFDFAAQVNDVYIIEELLKLYPLVKVLVLTTNLEAESVRNTVRAGASGYLYKAIASSELEQAIRAVYLGKRVFDTEVETLISQTGEHLAANYREMLEDEHMQANRILL